MIFSSYDNNINNILCVYYGSQCFPNKFGLKKLTLVNFSGHIYIIIILYEILLISILTENINNN